MTADAAPARRAGLALVLVLGLALPAATLGSYLLPDSLSLRIKARALSVPELLHPGHTEVINPYYRPLYILLQDAADRLGGRGSLGLRILALACHAFAALAVVALARSLRLPSRVLPAGLLLFLVQPGNVATASWPVVAYWTLAGALVFLAVADLVRYRSRGGAGTLARALLWVALSLLSAETAYSLVLLGPLLFLLPPRDLEKPGGRRRAALASAALLLLVLLHLLGLESGARGLGGAPVDRIHKALASCVTYWQGSLGGDRFGGDPRVALLSGFLILLGLRQAPRWYRFLLGLALLAPFPFAALGHAERYAYFASAPLSLLLAGALLERLPALLRMARVGPSRTTLPPVLVQLPGSALLAVFLVVLTLQSAGRVRDVREASAVVQDLDTDLARLVPELGALEGVAFVNLPGSMRWCLLDRLGVDSAASFDDAVRRLQLRHYFATAGHWFGPADAGAGLTTILQSDGRHLHRRDPSRPFGARERREPVFLAADFEVLSPPSDLPRGRHGALRWQDQVLARSRAEPDPSARVIVERPLPELTPPLPRERLEWRLAAPDRPVSSELRAGVRFDQHLVADLDLEQAGLLVVVTWFATPDPLARVTGDLGRFGDLFDVTLDGAPVEAVPVFYHSLGVVVPPGQHQVIVRQR